MLYRILTEDMNCDGIMEIVDGHFTGYTLYKTLGVYKGATEPSLVIEIDTGKERCPTILTYDETIKDIAGQIKKTERSRVCTCSENRL